MRYFAVCFMLILTGCINTPTPSRFEPLTYGAPLKLDVANINVISDMEAQDTGVASTFPITLDSAVREWANKRLTAAGRANRLDVVIKDASAKQVNLPVNTGFEGLLKDEPDTRIDARLEVELRLYSTRAISDASVNVVATRSQTLLEKTPPAERDRLMHSLVTAMMKDIDQSLERNIRAQFANVLVTR